MIVYLVTNRKNGKRYVGITTKGKDRRWYEHCWEAQNDSNQALHRAIRKHGEQAFSIEEIDQAETLEVLREKERHHIARLATHTTHGKGYNMTLGGEGVFGFEFDAQTRAAMARACAARFADPRERELQRQRQERYWTDDRRAGQREKTLLAHERDPTLAKRHSELMRARFDPAEMRTRSRRLWDDPIAREAALRTRKEYWSDPKNRARRRLEIKQRFADSPAYAKNVSEGKKRFFAENPEAGARHSALMKAKYAEDPSAAAKMRERMLRCYESDPTLKTRQGQSRRAFYEQNPDARSRAAATAREKAAQRRSLRDELTELVQLYQTQTGEIFILRSRADGGWQQDVMRAQINALRQTLGLDPPFKASGGETPEAQSDAGVTLDR